MMATGIMRRVDELGRVVLPIEIRRSLGIEERDALSIEQDEDRIILKKCQPSCVFCKTMKNIITYKDKCVCKECAEKIFKLDNLSKL